jgi:hypothetical protein
MSAWIDNTLDELDARLRELKVEISRRESEVSSLERRGLGRIHNPNALRTQLSRSTQSYRGYAAPQPARPVSASASAA